MTWKPIPVDLTPSLAADIRQEETDDDRIERIAETFRDGPAYDSDIHLLISRDDILWLIEQVKISLNGDEFRDELRD